MTQHWPPSPVKNLVSTLTLTTTPLRALRVVDPNDFLKRENRAGFELT